MSSLGGDCSSGSRCLSRATVSIVSSTDERGLGEPDDLLRVADRDLVDAVRAVDELDVGGGLTGGADDLLVPLVADEQDVVVLGGEPLRLVVHLGHQRAGRVDRLQRARLGLLVDLRGDAVRGEDHGGALGHLLVLLHEDRALGLQGLHHVLVVHDLLAHVDRGAVELQRLLDGLHGPVDARAVAAGLGQEHALAGPGGRLSLSHPPIVRADRTTGIGRGDARHAAGDHEAVRGRARGADGDRRGGP